MILYKPGQKLFIAEWLFRHKNECRNKCNRNVYRHPEIHEGRKTMATALDEHIGTVPNYVIQG